MPKSPQPLKGVGFISSDGTATVIISPPQPLLRHLKNLLERFFRN